MKKIVILFMILVIFISGCSNIESDKEQSSKTKETSSEKQRKATNSTDNKKLIEDPIEFAESKNGSIFFDKEKGKSFELVDKYTNKSSDKSGLTQTDNNGFKTNFTYMLVKDYDTKELSLAFFGEIKNETDKNLEYLNYVDFTTDTGEQIKPESGLLAHNNNLVKEYKPGAKSKGYSHVALKYQNEKPKQIDVIVSAPANNVNQNHYGKDIQLSLSINGNSKENDTSKSKDHPTNEPVTKESNTTEVSANNTKQIQVTSPEQCIMSGLVECDGITEEQKYTAYKNLVANGSLPQGTPGSGNLEQAVQDSFAIKNGQYNNWEEINKERQNQDNGSQYQQDKSPYQKEYTNDGHEKYNNNFSNEEINKEQANLDALLEEGIINQSEYDLWSKQIRN